MDNPFIETAKKIVSAKNRTDIKGLNGAKVSLHSIDKNKISLVIGADQEVSNARYFNKESLGALLKMLQEVHDLMEY